MKWKHAVGWALNSTHSDTHSLLPTFILRLRNDLYCVEWGVKLYSLAYF